MGKAPSIKSSLAKMPCIRYAARIDRVVLIMVPFCTIPDNVIFGARLERIVPPHGVSVPPKSGVRMMHIS